VLQGVAAECGIQAMPTFQVRARAQEGAQHNPSERASTRGQRCACTLLLRAAAARALGDTLVARARARGPARGAWQVGSARARLGAERTMRSLPCAQVWKGGKKQEELVGANKDNLEKMAAKYA
jgi:hypothetical protein